jgi:DNA-binding NarL/FixJ family response regulator
MEIVAAAATVDQATQEHQRARPDVILMDLQLGSKSGIDAIRVIRQRDEHARIVVLTMYQGDEDIYRAINAGAVTYLLKDTLADDLVRVIREVYQGNYSLSADLRELLAQRSGKRALTTRELQVLDLIAQGLRNKEIAATLNISQETIQVHVKNILAKLDVADRTAAVNVALRRGIIHISQ